MIYKRLKRLTLAVGLAVGLLLALFITVDPGRAGNVSAQSPPDLPDVPVESGADTVKDVHHADLDDERLWTDIEKAYHDGDRERLLALGAQVGEAQRATFDRILAEFDGEWQPEPVSAPEGGGPDVGINGNPCAYPSISNAISNASDGDTIYIPGNNFYYEQLGSIGKDLTFIASLSDCSAPIAGMDSDSVHINGGGASGGIWGGIAEINPGTTVTFTHIYLENAEANNGGILYVHQDAHLVLNNSEVADGSATTLGGGVRVYISGTLEMINESHIHLNETTGSGDGGGVALYQAAMTMTAGSTVGLGSGANVSADRGGGAYLHSSTLTMNDASFLDNDASSEGGGIFAFGTSSISLHGHARIGGYSNVFSNTATFGGGAYLLGPTLLALNDSSGVVNNFALIDGGGVYAESEADFAVQDDAEVMSNTAGFSGGGVFVTDIGSNLNMIYGGGELVGNTAFAFGGWGGGGVYATRGAGAYAEGALIENNSTAGNGGAVHVAQDGIITQWTGLILNNGAVMVANQALNGGGVYVRQDGSRVVVDGSRLENNEADSLGGGIRLLGNSGVTLTNGSVISYNAAPYGGGVHLVNGILAINDVSLERNIGITMAGGIYQSGGLVEAIDPEIRANDGGNAGGGIYRDGGILFLQAQNEDSYLAGNYAGLGGGLYDSGGNLTEIVANGDKAFHLSDNFGSGSGGGAYLTNGTGLSVVGKVFVDDNEASVNMGGGFYLDDSGLLLANVRVRRNSAGTDGGGVAAENGSEVFAYGVYTNPTTATLAPAAFQFPAGPDGTMSVCDPQALPAGTYCSEFRANEADGWGAGIFLNDSTATIVDTAFLDNAGLSSGTSPGTAILVGNSAEATVTNALFTGNGANDNSTVHVYSNASYSSDSSTYAGNLNDPLYVVGSAAVTLTNNVMWDNGSGALYQSGATINSACNDTQTALSGSGDISQDPHFAVGSYHLALGSPAIDACSSGPDHDLENAPRPLDGDQTPSAMEYDMGAFENDGTAELYLPAIVNDITS